MAKIKIKDLERFLGVKITREKALSSYDEDFPTYEIGERDKDGDYPASLQVDMGSDSWTVSELGSSRSSTYKYEGAKRKLKSIISKYEKPTGGYWRLKKR